MSTCIGACPNFVKESKYKLLVVPPNFMPVDTPQAILENNQNLTDRIVGTYINRAIVFSNTMHALIFI